MFLDIYFPFIHTPYENLAMKRIKTVSLLRRFFLIHYVQLTCIAGKAMYNEYKWQT